MTTTDAEKPTHPAYDEAGTENPLLLEHAALLTADGYVFRGSHMTVTGQRHVHYELPDGSDYINMVVCSDGCHIQYFSPVSYSKFRRATGDQ